MTTMEQFYQMKAKHPDALLLFRIERKRFYEAYREDAVECARILETPLASDKTHGMLTSFPFSRLDTFLPKLIRAGRRVAICDALKTPKQDIKIELNLTKKQFELLCECIRYRCSDNQAERESAAKKGLSTTFYDSTADELEELKNIVYQKA